MNEMTDERLAYLRNYAAQERDFRLRSAVDEIDRLRADFAAKEAEKNGAYAERNKVVAALAKLFPSGVLRDTDEAGWWIVFIDLPDGQASWHFHESELDLLVGIPKYEGEWDGHSTEEKYARLKSLHPAYFRFPDALHPEPTP